MIISFSILVDARLSLFGSSCNGFGFQNSDLDICMTLEGEDQKVLYLCVFFCLRIYVDYKKPRCIEKYIYIYGTPDCKLIYYCCFRF